VAQAVAVVKPWVVEQWRPRSKHVWHSGAIVRTVWLMSGAHAVLYFSKLSKLPQMWKLKMDALPHSKNSQFLHIAILGQWKKFYQLCRHPILNRIGVKNPRTDST
jgi:hypothetical protein